MMGNFLKRNRKTFPSLLPDKLISPTTRQHKLRDAFLIYFFVPDAFPQKFC